MVLLTVHHCRDFSLNVLAVPSKSKCIHWILSSKWNSSIMCDIDREKEWNFLVWIISEGSLLTCIGEGGQPEAEWRERGGLPPIPTHTNRLKAKTKGSPKWPLTSCLKWLSSSEVERTLYLDWNGSGMPRHSPMLCQRWSCVFLEVDVRKGWAKLCLSSTSQKI